MTEKYSGQLQVLKMWQIFVILSHDSTSPCMSLLDQSGVTGGGLDPYNVHALFVNMHGQHVDGNIWKLCSSCLQLQHRTTHSKMIPQRVLSAMSQGIGRSRGVCPVHAPPMGPNFFVFAYIFTKKCPRRRSTPP